MKNLIYLNDYKNNISLSSNVINSIEKLNKSKLYELYTTEINKYKQSIKLTNEYILIPNTNYQKILTMIILNIIKNYTENNKTKPHIIITNYESNYIFLIFKQLIKANLIELSIIESNFGINILIDELKKNKKSNTIMCFLSPISNNIYYNNINKIYSYCKYYNILVFSNIENELYNYYQIDYNIFNNQDIILLNYNKYIVNNKIITYIFIKNKFLAKYKTLIPEIQKFILTKININSNYLINILDINKSLTNKTILKEKLKINYLSIFNYLKDRYKIITYENLIKSNNIKYFYNTCTIILLQNLKDNIMYNTLSISLFMPNIKFSNINEYFKSSKIILSNQYKFPFNKQLKYLNEIKKGLISINFGHTTKPFEINKFLNTITDFININLKTDIIKRKRKKTVRFTTPEFIILNKPFVVNKKKLKSILKKK